MNKFNFRKVAAVGLCCSIISTSSVWAMPRTIALNEVPVSLEAGVENQLLEKQREIDQYIFQTHAEDIADTGFKVTNTGLLNGYVEIGILPYNEDNANYLYNIFGKEKVKVVKGIQAVALPLAIVDEATGSYNSNFVQGNKAIGIQINGEVLELDAEPFIENNRTLIPLRAVMEKLGAEVEWYAEQKTVKVHTDDISIELVIGEATAKVIRNKDGISNEEIIQLDVPSNIVGNRTFIPGRFVAEALEATVEWDEASNTMIVHTESKDDSISVERIIDFEKVERKLIEENDSLSKWYQDNSKQEGIYNLIDGEWIYVLVSAGEKPTGGYSAKIDSITEVTPGTAYVYAVLNSPDKNSFVTQALTYPNAVARFHKGDIKQLQGDLADAQQDVDNAIKDNIGESLKEMGKAISIDSIKEMKLYSLMQEEIKTFSTEEIKELINHLNTSPTYNGAYIEMLAGNNIKIALNDGSSIQLTSFGSKDYVIMSGEVNGEHKTYCIVSPEIGSILLSQKNKADNEQEQYNDVLQQENETDKKAVRNIVESFGLKLQMVSLQAPKDILQKSMQENYSDFVSQTLLDKWISDPTNAPGRLTSSPWPDRIEIAMIEKTSENEYKVNGEIIEITSTEKESGGVAAKKLSILIVKKINDSWLIDDVILGDYNEANGVVYKDTQYGFDFSLPDTWKDYKVVTDQWKGLSIEDLEDSKAIEKGPLIYIRHPEWTIEKQRQDIPIMIFTLDQWNSLQNQEFHIGGAPMGPSELGRNAKFIFALPARYNYAFPEGYEGVEDILESNPIQPNEHYKSDSQ
ncbi:MAG: stalk domain-containing protein [Clostridia bacterium]